MPHQTAEAIAGSVTIYSTVVSGSMALIAFLADDHPEVAAGALQLGGGALGLGLFTYLGKLTSEYFADRKDARANELLRYQAENDRRLNDLESAKPAEKERRRLDRELLNGQLIVQRNKLESAEAKIQALRDGQRTNGQAALSLGAAIGHPVEVSIPPDGSGDHPTLP